MNVDPGDVSQRIGHRFSDPELLRRALTHRSYGVLHNERLEFLGDSIVNCAIALELHGRFSDLSEGELSRLRANLVNQDALYRIALAINLGNDLLLGEGELKSGGFTRPSILADAFEALVGAIFLDGGFVQAEAVLGRGYRPLLSRQDLAHVTKDSKTRLQEFLQARRLALPAYEIAEIRGESHAQWFRVTCRVAELSIEATGEGASRRAAEQAAAQSAIESATHRG